MVDLTILAEAAARDPLLGAFVLMATGALVSRLLFKQQPIWRAIVRVVFLMGTSKNTPSARPANQIQRISLNLTTGSGCDGAIGFL